MRRGVRIAVGAAVALGLAAAGAYGLYAASRGRCFVLTGHTLCRVETAAAMVALTFDDGPTEEGLNAILPELERHRAHATFFLIGADAEKHPEMVRALLAAGQEVGNHSWSHLRMVGRSAAFYDAELARTNAALRAAGAEPTLFRPPYGKKLFGLPLAVERAGMTMVTWDVEDPTTRDPQAFARQVVAQARPGSIILVHAMYANNRTGRAALPMILDGLAAKGLRVVSVGELRAAASPSPRPS
jgi:peptidoglycan/xylan/chitin deacetylase (PgdA/CDA1 family)